MPSPAGAPALQGRSVLCGAQFQLSALPTGKELALPIGSDEEVVSFASTLVAADRDQAFVVRADRGVRYERIDTVLEALKQANARDVYLLSEQETALLHR